MDENSTIDPEEEDAEALAQEEAMMAAAESEADNEILLKQNEIDNFFSVDTPKAKTGTEILVDSGALKHERLPMLEVVYDKLIRLLSTSLRNFSLINVDISLIEITSIRFGEYLDSVPLPAMFNIFKIIEWEGSGIITTDTSLLYAMVNVLLGGRKSGQALGGRIEGRPFTAIERNLTQRFIELVVSDLGTAFEVISPVSCQFERQEVLPQLVGIVPANNISILTKIKIDLEGAGGILEILIPASTLEPARDQLLQMYLGEKFGHDHIWESHLSNEVWASEIALTGVLSETFSTLDEVLNWKVGSILMLDPSCPDRIELRCGDKKLFKGKLGHKNSNLAVQINKITFKDSPPKG